MCFLSMLVLFMIDKEDACHLFSSLMRQKSHFPGDARRDLCCGILIRRESLDRVREGERYICLIAR